MTRVELPGQVAVVTGAAGRLGPVWCRALLEAGADVAGLDLRDHQPPETTGPAGRYLSVGADVTDRSALRRAAEQVAATFGDPTIIVNNAGIDQPPSARGLTWTFGDVPDEVSESVLSVNALGVLRTCQVFGPILAARSRGSIVNIGSIYGRLAPDPRLYEHLQLDPPFLKPPAYPMSKACVSALTRYLAALWGPSGVRVNTLSPGGVLGEQDDEFIEKFSARVPLRRMAQPDDLVGPLLFLTSNLGRYVTGQELMVDGGITCTV